MRIHSLSKVLAMPIIVGTVALAYYQYENDIQIGYWIAVPLFLIVFLYVSHGYIDYWYHTKYPIPLDGEVLSWLRQYSPFYRGLSESDREKYEYRMSLYLEGRSFQSVGSEQKELPQDLKGIIASNAIQINFNKKDILIGDFDRIFVYKHPFPTPLHQFLHSVETQAEDGVIIYSLEHLIPGMIDTENFYNIGMHAYVEAYTKAYPTLDYPWKLDASWADVEQISGLTEEKIMATLGYDTVDLFTVLGTCYFTYPSAFAKRLPKLSQQLDAVFAD